MQKTEGRISRGYPRADGGMRPHAQVRRLMLARSLDFLSLVKGEKVSHVGKNAEIFLEKHEEKLPKEFACNYQRSEEKEESLKYFSRSVRTNGPRRLYMILG